MNKKNMNILLVEDNPLITGLMLRMFKSLGYEIDIATSVAAALKHVVNKTYQLIISDIGLPDANGAELVAELRALEQQNASVPAYICGATAFDLDQYRQPCFEAGFDEMIAKPMNLHFLRHLILKAHVQASKK